MTGPEHYREAERLLSGAVTTDNPFPHLRPDELLGAAQVHATLALAAATALGARGDGIRVVGMHREDLTAWDDVAGVEGE